MMIYRKYQPGDEEQLRQIHAQRGYTFDFPDLSQPDFVSIWVAEEDGRIVGAVAAKRTVEISAFISPEYANPAMRLEIISGLQERGALHLKEQGFTDMECFVKNLPGFARRLVRSLGWIRSSGGDCYVRSV